MLNQFSDKELKNELDRREAEHKKAIKPKQVETPDLSELREICQDYIDKLDTHGYEDDDYSEIYEVAMQTIFGNDVFEWINKQIK